MKGRFWALHSSGLKGACGAFSERADWLVAARVLRAPGYAPRAKSVVFARQVKGRFWALHSSVSNWLKVACGAFSERADWLVAARGLRAPGKKRGFCPLSEGPVLGASFVWVLAVLIE